MEIQHPKFENSRHVSIESVHERQWLMRHPSRRLCSNQFTSYYWAKILTDHPKNCDNVFVVQYFGMNFGTLNENTVWHQSCASVGICHSACSLRMRIYIKPLICTCNARNDLNRNSNQQRLFVQMTLN